MQAGLPTHIYYERPVLFLLISLLFNNDSIATKSAAETHHKMSQAQIKYRLTGAVIIVGIAIIVISVLLKTPANTPNTSFDHTDSNRQTFVLDLPNVSDVSNTDSADGEATSDDTSEEVDKPALQPKVDTPVISAQNPVVESSAKDTNSTENTVLTKDEQSIPSTKSVPQADESSHDISKDGEWSVRVGTYSKTENVNIVSALLKRHGFEAQQTKVQTTLGPATRIWLGPYSKKQTAEKVSLRLKTINGEKGYVTKQSS